MTDIITAFIFHRPLFCIEGNGGECSVYGGLGYIIVIYYHWDGWVSYPQINAWGYVIINAIIFTTHFIVKHKKAKNKDLYKCGGDKIFSNGFPHTYEEIVRRAIAVIPLKTYRNVKGRVSDNNICYFLGQTQVSFPYRLYSLEVEDSIFERLDCTEKTILHCIYTRSCDGYVREKHIKALLSGELPEWAIPYIVKVCDEYVVEILQTVYDNLKDSDTEKIKKFCSDNRETFCKSYNRMISYWNEFYRDRCYKFEDYIGRKLFIECFGASRKMNCSK